MDPNIKNIADSILSGVKTQLGSDWQKLAPLDQQIVSEVAADAATLVVRAAGAPDGNPSVAAEQKQITAQLANIEAATAVGAVNTFWSVTAQVMTKAVSVATTALIAAV